MEVMQYKCNAFLVITLISFGGIIALVASLAHIQKKTVKHCENQLKAGHNTYPTYAVKASQAATGRKIGL